MQNHPDRYRRIRRFFSRNGVYLVLAIGILAVTAVILAGVADKVSKPEPDDSLNAQQQVEQKVTGQKDTRPQTTTTAFVPTTTTTTLYEAPHLYVLPLSNTVQKPFSVNGPLYCETMKDWRLHLGADFAGE